jgi:hypothetical protein
MKLDIRQYMFMLRPFDGGGHRDLRALVGCDVKSI